MRRSGSENVQEVLAVLAEEGFVHHADGQWNWTNESYPADAVSLRSVSSDNFVVVDTHERRARHRRDRLHERTVDAAREGDLHGRGAAVPGRAARLRRPQGLRSCGRVRLLHDAITYTKVTILDTFAQTTARPERALPESATAGSRREPDGTADADRTARSMSSRASSDSRRSSSTPTRTSGRVSWISRAADAHIVVLADDSDGDHGGVAVCRRRSPRRRRRPGVRDAPHRAAGS